MEKIENYTPNGMRLLLEVIELEKKSRHGITLTQTVKEVRQGKVIGLGTGRFEYGVHITPQAEVGDIVHFQHHLATEVEIDKKSYVLINEPDVLGFLKNENTDNN